ncbi:MAG: phosphatase PAP2 family protein [Tepidisphaerales bacterium]
MGTAFDPRLLGALLAGCVLLLLAEHLGARTTLNLESRLKGDVKRESRWVAQYGQSVCTPVAALLVWLLDGVNGLRNGVIVLGSVLAASVLCMLLKRTLGRIRPGREGAGRFTGLSLRHANYRESFPSSHSACAVALTVTLVAFYPAAAPVLWALALGCAGLRYVLDAHFPSDVLAGVALGYAVGHGGAALGVWLWGSASATL